MGKKRRGNNEGSISRRQDGRFMSRITIGRDPSTGKLKRAYFYGKTRKEVADQLARALGDLNRGSFVAPHKLTVGEWLETWLREYKASSLRPISYDSYEMLARHHIKPTLGHIPLRGLRPDHPGYLFACKPRPGKESRSEAERGFAGLMMWVGVKLVSTQQKRVSLNRLTL